MIMMPPTRLHWLEGQPSRQNGVTWGCGWLPGELSSAQQAVLETDTGSHPVDSWPTAFWPDGSIKWTGHAVGADATPAAEYRIHVADATSLDTDAGSVVTVTEDDSTIGVDNGILRIMINKSGTRIVDRIERRDDDGSTRTVACNGRLISLLQDQADLELGGSVTRTPYTGTIDTAVVERHGSQRAIVRIDGRHTADAPAADGTRRSWLPFRIRLAIYAGSEQISATHTMIFDGDEYNDFLAGLGICFDVPMVDELHNRHIRLSGRQGGFLTESVRGLTGLRRDPGVEVREAQIAGRPTPPTESWNPAVSSRLALIPAWGDYTLAQLSPDGFTLVKRTGPGHGWIPVASGGRSAGFSYLGGASGGLGLGLRDFWQSFPTQLDIRNADSDLARSTVWMYSPQAPPMDLRFYHDGMGQDGYAEQLDGLEITYEDYEPGFGTPYGIARTHQLAIFAYATTPAAEQLAADAQLVAQPPLLTMDSHDLAALGVFGDWAPVDRSTPARARIEDRIELLIDYYQRQREERRWYGFWNYGDVMHSYDSDRHVWRYDVGGFAWDNSELSTDLWLWYSYLRSGRADIFRFAEAMTRHTGEVDVYHLGRWRGLGSRHNVQHWGCSAKQLRISSPVYRRIYFYLTADERIADLIDELADNDHALLGLDARRKVRDDGYLPDDRAQLAVSLGTDYGALAATWLAAWERHQDLTARDKLIKTMIDIGELAYGFLTGETTYDLDRGRLDTSRVAIAVSHLSAVFGMVEVCSEVISIADRFGIDIGTFRDAWLQYCRLFLATPEERQAELGRPMTGHFGLVQGHSRLTAYAANRLQDSALAAKAWEAFTSDERIRSRMLEYRQLDQPRLLSTVNELPGVSTNGAAQYGLAAIQNLALLSTDPPSSEP